MKLSRLIFPLLLIIPIVEIYFFILVGKSIGVGWTLLLIILTAIIGTQLLKNQGRATVARAQAMAQRGEMPAVALFEGLMLLISGILLLTPGFFTDGIGLLFLFPPTRYLLMATVVKWFGATVLKNKNATTTTTDNPQQADQKQPIEGEFYRKD